MTYVVHTNGPVTGDEYLEEALEFNESVSVCWKDAHCSLEALTVEEACDIGPAMTVSTGFLLRADDIGVVVASDKHFLEHHELSFTGFTFIPKEIVEYIKVL